MLSGGDGDGEGVGQTLGQLGGGNRRPGRRHGGVVSHRARNGLGGVEHMQYTCTSR